MSRFGERDMGMKRYLLGMLALVLLLLTACSAGNRVESTWQEQYDLGVRYLSEGNYEEAFIAFTAAIEIDPNRAEAYVGRGDAYVGSGETEENLTAALADYEAALGLDDTSAAAWLGLADVYIRQREYDRALEVLQEGLDKTGGNENVAEKIEEIENGILYDSAGNIRRRRFFDANGNLLWYHVNMYDSSGRWIATVSYDSVGNRTGIVNIPYDDFGNQLSSPGYAWSDGIVSIPNWESVQIEYDEYDRRNRIESITDTGELEGYMVYSYTPDGNVSETASYSGDGTYLGKTMYVYDSRGLLIQQNVLDETDHINSSHVYEYDAAGNKIKYEVYYNDNLITYILYNYADNGKLMSAEHYEQDTLIGIEK